MHRSSTPTHRSILLIVLVLLLTGAACGLPLPATYVPTSTPKPMLMETSVVLGEQSTATPAAAEATITPTVTEAAPTPTNTVEPSITATNTEAAPPTKHFEFEGVSLDYLPELATDVKGQIVPAAVNEANGIGWNGPIPDYYQLDFSAFALPEGSHPPRILVYRIQTYAQVNPPAGDAASLLQNIVAKKSFDEKKLPFLPMWNAGKVFSERHKIVSFANGGGLAYLTCYAQSYAAIHRSCLFYTFQGITTDGKYYVSAILPVALPALETGEVQSKLNLHAADMQTMYEEYLKGAKAVIQAAQPGDFQPNLDALDAMMQSLIIQPGVELKAPVLPAFTCAGALETRLRAGIQARVTFTDGTPLNVRQGAGKSNKVVGTLKEGAAMEIIGGPMCVEQGVWWMIQSGNLSGWVLEGSGTYYVEPAH